MDSLAPRPDNIYHIDDVTELYINNLTKYLRSLMLQQNAPAAIKYIDKSARVCEQLLEIPATINSPEGKTKRQRLATKLFNYQIILQTKAFWLSINDGPTQELVLDIIKLRRLDLLSRYGDYFAQHLAKFKNLIRENSEGLHAEFAQPRRNWTMVNRELDAEAAATGKDSINDPTCLTFKFRRAVGLTGFNYDSVRLAIRIYAERNMQCHADLDELLASQLHAKLAEKLQDDLKDIEKAYSYDDENGMEEKALLKEMIREKVYHWFEEERFGGQDPADKELGFWLPTDAYKTESAKSATKKDAPTPKGTAANVRRAILKDAKAFAKKDEKYRPVDRFTRVEMLAEEHFDSFDKFQKDLDKNEATVAKCHGKLIKESSQLWEPLWEKWEKDLDDLNLEDLGRVGAAFDYYYSQKKIEKLQIEDTLCETVRIIKARNSSHAAWLSSEDQDK